MLYGHGAQPRPLAVVRRELRQALTTEAGMNALIDLEVDGSTQLTLVRDLQRDPVRNAVTHVDFILVSRDEVMTVDVPVTVAGEAEEVNRAAGTVEQVLFALAISARPGRIPNELTVDVTGMAIGDTIRVGDISLPEGVSTEVDPDEAVVTAAVSRATFEAEDLAADASEGDGAAEDAPA